VATDFGDVAVATDLRDVVVDSDSGDVVVDSDPGDVAVDIVDLFVVGVVVTVAVAFPAATGNLDGVPLLRAKKYIE